MNVEQSIRALVQVRADQRRPSRFSVLRSDPEFFQSGKSTLARVVAIKGQIALIDSFGKSATLQGNSLFQRGDWIRVEPEADQASGAISDRATVRLASSPINESILKKTDTNSTSFSSNPADLSHQKLQSSEMKLLQILQDGKNLQFQGAVRLTVVGIKMPHFLLNEEFPVLIKEAVGHRAIAEIKGNQYVVETSRPVVPGTRLQSQVISLQPRFLMDSYPVRGESAESSPLGASWNKGGTPNQNSLIKGQSIYAELVSQENGNWILDLAGKRYLTRQPTLPKMDPDNNELIPVRIAAKPDVNRLLLELQGKRSNAQILVEELNSLSRQPDRSNLPLRLEMVAAKPPDLREGESVSLKVEQARAGDFTVKVKNVRVAVQATRDLEVGQEIQARVIRTSPHPVLESRSGESSYQPISDPGRISLISGSVIRELGGNVFQLQTDVGVWEVMAPRKLELGQEVIFQTRQSESGTRISVLDWGTPVESVARSVIEKELPHLQQPEKMFQNLRVAVEKALFESAEGRTQSILQKLHHLMVEFKDSFQSVERLSRFVRDGGLHYENKLANYLVKGLQPELEQDLKGLLLQLAGMSGGNASTALDPVYQIGEQYLKWLEVQQASNILNSLSGEPYRLGIPFTIGDESILAQLSFSEDGRGDSEDSTGKRKGMSVLFLLDLDGFGKTRIDAFLSSTELSVNIYLENKEAIPVVNRELASLYESLQGDGFDSLRIEVRALADLDQKARREPDLIGSDGVKDQIRLLNIEV